MPEIEEENNKKVITITPVGKGKRTLLYLCDVVITFIMSFIMFYVAVLPLSEIIMNYTKLNNDIVKLERKRNSVLASNSILHYKKNYDDTFEDMFDQTFEDYFKGVVTGNEIEKNDVIHIYYVNIRGKSESEFIDIMKDVDKDIGFYTFDSGSYKLKYIYQNEFKAFFSQYDTPSDQAKTDKETFKDKSFTPLYSLVIQDIEKNDLIYNDITYKECQNQIHALSNKWDAVLVVDAFISLFIGGTVGYLLIPIINKHRKTISMIFMRIENVDAKKLELKDLKMVLLGYIYNLLTSLWSAFFLPLPIVAFTYLFALPVLLPLCLVSVSFVVISLFVMLFSEYNRTLCDYLTNSAIISDTDLDQIYCVRGIQE